MCFPSVFCRPIQTPFPGPKTYPANRVGMVYHTGTVPKGFSAHAGRLHARVQRSKLCTSSPPSRPWRKSAPFRVGYSLVAEALSAPLQGGFRLLRRSSTPSAVPSLAVGIPPPRGGGTSGAYPVVQWGEADGEAASSSPTGPGATVADVGTRRTDPHAFLAPAYQHLWPVRGHGP